MKNVWKDKTNNFRCESCGKSVFEKDLYYEKGMGYCKECFDDIQKYENKVNHFPVKQPE